ncbi:MAG: hypothetical protein ACTSSJ_02985 [Candidatus Odinarchaeia archaeon]
MRPIIHFIASAILAVIGFSVSGSVSTPTIIFLSGVLIDLDHFLDYLFNEKTLRGCFKRLLSGKYFHEKRVLIQLFHAYEWVSITLCLSPFLGINGLWMGLSVGLHIAMDIYAYKPRLVGYSLIFRFFKNFSLEAINPNQFKIIK